MLQLERWAEVVRDYRTLKQELPNDNEVTENLAQALLALEKSRKVVNGSTTLGLEVEVEEVTTLDKFKAAIAFTGKLATFLFDHKYQFTVFLLHL